MKFEEIQDALNAGKTCYRDSDLNMADDLISDGLFGNEYLPFDEFLKIYGITRDSEVDEMDKLADDWVIFEEEIE